jgi:hypothetical protein
VPYSKLRLKKGVKAPFFIEVYVANRTKKIVTVIGWREWVALPELNIDQIKVKIDSGARTSALHAEEIRMIKNKDGSTTVSFSVVPSQDKKRRIRAKATLVDRRWVRSSTGAATLRPVISTLLKIGGKAWPIEITLINRDPMGFRMLVGRQALGHGFLIDPAKSFLLGPQTKEKNL